MKDDSMFITTLLLWLFSGMLTAGGLAFAVWGFCQLAAGREFAGLGLPGDIATALHAELDRRYRASLAQ